MNSRYDPCAAGNLPPTIGRLISCRPFGAAGMRHDVPNFVAVQRKGAALGMSGSMFMPLSYQMETTN
jgi:hypothetical protein